MLTLGGSLIAGGLYNLTSASPAARTPNPITDAQMHSGHSLTDAAILGGAGFPYRAYAQYLDTLNGDDPDVTAETWPGSSMTYRRADESANAYFDMTDYQIISTIERNDAYPDAIFQNPQGWVVDEQNRIKSEMALWFTRSQTVGNGSAGADFFFFTPWCDHANYNTGGNDVTVNSWRERLGYDHTFYENVATYAEESHGSGTVWIIPATKLMMDLYDDAENGDIPNIANAAAFMASGDWWLDGVHQGDLLKLAHIYLHAYVIHHQDPRGTASTGFGLTDEPSAAEATYIQNRVYDTIQAYPRAGVVT